jgi:hypothetical protein
MNHRDITALMDGIAPVLRGYVKEAFEPIGARMLELEKRFNEMPAPRDPDPVMILRLVEETVAKVPPALPGKDADPALVAELVDKAVAALPPAKDGEPGTSVTVEDLAPLVADEVAKAVSAIKLPTVDWSEVDKMIGDRVEGAVSALPPALPGKDADPAQIAATVATEVERAVAALPAAKDGIGLASALIDREGCLVVTLTDGTTKTLGAVVGKDVDIDAVSEMVRAEVAKLPVPKDGLGFEDMTVEPDGDRGVIMRFERGDLKKEFALSFPMVIDRGVWREQGYAKGDGVTWGGSFFIAQRATEPNEKPGASDAFRLSVKKGRDGKDGAPGKPGERGPKGEPARNIV